MFLYKSIFGLKTRLKAQSGVSGTVCFLPSLATKLRITTYIKTLQDVVVSPVLQDRMIAEAGIKTIYQLNTSHSPFLSKPQEVSELLLQIGQ
jgi:hypothetical protein